MGASSPGKTTLTFFPIKQDRSPQRRRIGREPTRRWCGDWVGVGPVSTTTTNGTCTRKAMACASMAMARRRRAQIWRGCYGHDGTWDAFGEDRARTGEDMIGRVPWMMGRGGRAAFGDDGTRTREATAGASITRMLTLPTERSKTVGPNAESNLPQPHKRGGEGERTREGFGSYLKRLTQHRCPVVYVGQTGMWSTGPRGP